MRITWLAASALLIGCAQGPGNNGPQPQTTGTTAPVGTLNMTEMTDSAIVGTYDLDGERLTFEGRVAQPDLITTTLTLHGMTLDATLDTRDGNRMWTQDGFATATGADTTLENEDRLFIAAFVKALEAKYPDVGRGSGLDFHFDAVVNLWAQWVPAMALSNIKFEDKERAIDMCWWAMDSCGNWGYGGTPCALDKFHSYDGHDCDDCSGDPVQGQGFSSCSSYVMYGNWYAGGNQTYYYYNNVWNTSASGHGNGAYEIGDCFGRYGDDCGSGTAYFQENASHDHCVRNAHVIYSSWCSDELWRTTDPYNCY